MLTLFCCFIVRKNVFYVLSSVTVVIPDRFCATECGQVLLFSTISCVVVVVVVEGQMEQHEASRILIYGDLSSRFKHQFKRSLMLTLLIFE